jgi:hypothetical protein
VRFTRVRRSAAVLATAGLAATTAFMATQASAATDKSGPAVTASSISSTLKSDASIPVPPG